MDKLDILFWSIGSFGTLIMAIVSAVWYEVKEVRKMVGNSQEKCSERFSNYEVRLTCLENTRPERIITSIK